jgi:hypothetical protein
MLPFSEGDVKAVVNGDMGLPRKIQGSAYQRERSKICRRVEKEFVPEDSGVSDNPLTLFLGECMSALDWIDLGSDQFVKLAPIVIA